MKKLGGIVACLLLSLSVLAQSTERGKITVIVLSEDNKALENITVELRKKDNKLVKAAITDKNGVAELDNIIYGEYVLKASSVNYAEKLTPISLSSPVLEVGKISLAATAGNAGNVTVTATKPFLQKLQDRLIVNVDNSVVNAGSTAFEVLERSPGVQIDQNDNISLRGRSGVIIMIDGRISPMTGADLANYLRSLPTNAIESIHLITNPSAKYDAAGNSGIIDIRMKKDQRFGMNGTFTAGYGQGVYPKANSGITMNYRNKKVNLFGNYNYAYRVGLNHLLLDRNFFKNDGSFTGRDLKDNYAKFPFTSNNLRFGADFFPSKKTIIGFVVNGTFNKFKRTTTNDVEVFNAANQPTSTFITRAGNNDRNQNIFANANFKHTFDSSGKELTADIDYGVFNSSSLSTNFTSYFKMDGTMLQPNYRLDGDQDGKLTLKSAKADYLHPINATTRFEAGIKSSYVSSDNDAKFWDVSSSHPVNDVNKTNRFFYEEYNNAAYATFGKEFKKWDFKVGLRTERTDIKTKQVKGNIDWDSSYTQFFPSAFLNYKVGKEQTIGASVSRRIDRPGYSQLNPFLFLIDVTTYATGNPNLLPQLTWSYELSYTVKNINFTLGYSHSKQNQNIAIVRFPEVFPHISEPKDSNTTVQIPINLAGYDYYGLTAAAPIKVTKWWNMINNLNVYYGHFKGRLGITSLNNGRPAVNMSTNNTFSLKKGWTTELNAVFNSGSQSGFMVSKPSWGLSAGVQKNIWKNKGTVRFNVTDIFWTNLPRATITYANYVEKWRAYRETRVANLTFTYRFGNNKVQAARRRATASEEERQRIGG